MDNIDKNIKKVVIYVQGGNIQDIRTNDPTIKVEVFDIDIFDSGEKLDNKMRTKEEFLEDYFNAVRDMIGIY